jgi:hypothetical protein
VLGDKANGTRSKQFNDFNDGHVVDIAEIGSGDSGEDTCVEVKVFSSLTKSGGTGRGGVNGGTTAAVGHKYGFGNTEEPCRVANLGCKPRGRQSGGPFNHDTGKGWVKGKQGEYHDALFNKNNRVEIVLHENLWSVTMERDDDLRYLEKLLALMRWQLKKKAIEEDNNSSAHKGTDEGLTERPARRTVQSQKRRQGTAPPIPPYTTQYNTI